MALKVDFKNNFTSGEISTKLKGRYDLELYKTGVEKMKDAFTNTQTSLINKTIDLDIDEKFAIGSDTDLLMFFEKERDYDKALVEGQHDNVDRGKETIIIASTKEADRKFVKFIVFDKDKKEIIGRTVSTSVTNRDILEFIQLEDNYILVKFSDVLDKNSASNLVHGYLYIMKIKNDPARGYVWDGNLIPLQDLLVEEKEVEGINEKIHKEPTDPRNYFYEDMVKNIKEFSAKNMLSGSDTDANDMITTYKRMKHAVYRKDPKSPYLELSFYDKKLREEHFMEVYYVGRVKEINGNEREMTLDEAKEMFPHIISKDFDSGTFKRIEDIVMPLDKDDDLKPVIALKKVKPKKEDIVKQLPSGITQISYSNTGKDWKHTDDPYPHKGDNPSGDINDDTKASSSFTRSVSYVAEQLKALGDHFITYTLTPKTKYRKPDEVPKIMFGNNNLFKNFALFEYRVVDGLGLEALTADNNEYFSDANDNIRYQKEYNDDPSFKKFLFDVDKIDDHTITISGKVFVPVRVKYKYTKEFLIRETVDLGSLKPLFSKILNEMFIMGGVCRYADLESGLEDDVLKFRVTKKIEHNTEIVNKSLGHTEIIWKNASMVLVWFRKFTELKKIKEAIYLEKRLMLFNTGNSSSEFLSSAFREQFDFTYTTGDNMDPYNFDLVTTKQTEAFKIIKRKNIFIITDEGIFGAIFQKGKEVLKSNFDLITSVKPATDVEPLMLDDNLIFVAKNKKKMFMITMNEYGNQFKLEDLTSANDELLKHITSLGSIDFDSDSGYSVFSAISKVGKSNYNNALIKVDAPNKTICYSSLSLRSIKRFITHKGVTYGISNGIVSGIPAGWVIPIIESVSKESEIKLLPPSVTTNEGLPMFFNQHYNINSVKIYCGGPYDIEVNGFRLKLGRKPSQYETFLLEFPIEIGKFNEPITIKMYNDDGIKAKETTIYSIATYYDGY